MNKTPTLKLKKIKLPVTSPVTGKTPKPEPKNPPVPRTKSKTEPESAIGNKAYPGPFPAFLKAESFGRLLMSMEAKIDKTAFKTLRAACADALAVLADAAYLVRFADPASPVRSDKLWKKHAARVQRAYNLVKDVNVK